MSLFKNLKLSLRLVAFILLALIIFGTCGCSKSNGRDSSVLIVGTSVDLPPFCGYDQYGDPDGFDIALIKAMAEKMGYRSVEFKTMDFSELMTRLNSGQVDCVVSAMAVNEDRKNNVAFSQVYYTSRQAIILRNNINEEDDIKIEEVGDLATLRVSVVEDTLGDKLTTLIISDSDNITRRDDTVSAINEVINARSDAVVIEEEAAYYYLQKYNSYVHKSDAQIFEEKAFAIAVRQDDTELLENINKSLDTVKKDGTYDELVEKYIINQ